MASEGKKFTSAPETHQNPIQEGAGLVTSDSLAAESTKKGGGFAQNTNAAVSAQPSSSTTSNTTDTRNAAELPPAHDAQSRPDAPLGNGETSVNKIAERAEQHSGSEHVDPQSTVGGGKAEDVEPNEGTHGSAEQQRETQTATWKEFHAEKDSAIGSAAHADPHSTAGEHSNAAGSEKTSRSSDADTATGGTGGVGTNTNREGFGSETHTTISDTGTRRLHGTQKKAGEEEKKLIEEHRANLPLPEQPPRASDWNSADERNVNLGTE